MTSVGGTQLHLDAQGNRTAPDRVWNDTYNTTASDSFTGSHGPNPFAGWRRPSVIFARPSYQNGVRSVVGRAPRRPRHLDERRL